MGDGEGSPNFRLIPEADTCLCLTGELDAAAAPALEAGLALVEHHSDLVLDLSRLTFLDAADVGVLVDTAGALQEGDHLVLRSPRGIVRRVIDLLGLTEHPRIRVDEQ